jgi:acyl carrier protein
MGLDVVELIMDIEQHFGIRIPDADAERLYSVGDLYVYVLARTGRSDPVAFATPCPTSRAFYRVRRALTGELGVERSRVRPAVALRDLLPRETRPDGWSRLVAALRLQNPPDPDPPPRGPTWRVFWRAVGAATAAAWALYLLIYLLPGERTPVAIGFLFWFLSLLLVGELFGIFWLDGRFFNPAPVPKVRDLALRLAAWPGTPGAEESPADSASAAVWTELTAILARHLGMQAESIRPEQRFTGELRLD